MTKKEIEKIDKERDVEKKRKTKVQEFMKKWSEKTEDLQNYDFRKQIIDFKEGLGDVDKYFIYKALDISSKDLGYEEARSDIREETNEGYEKSDEYEKDREADNCSLMQAVYHHLWDEKYLIYCLMDGLLTGDTMNSGLMTIIQFLKPSTDQLECRKGNWGNKKVFCLYHDNKKKVRELLRPTEAFLTAAYTLGNFMPVPIGCNGLRGTGPTKDYWDLTLYYIYRWYLNNEQQLKMSAVWPRNEALSHLLGTKTVLYQDWLAAFGSWDRFVIANYMQDFVHKADPTIDLGQFGRPKELWYGHFEGAPLPKGEQCEDFFENVTTFIKGRSKRMARAFEEKLRQEKTHN